MAIKVLSYNVNIGEHQNIGVARGEDVSLNFKFLIPTPDGSPGTPVDFTGQQAITLNVRDKLGKLLFSRLGTVVGSPIGGAVAFVVTQSDTITQALQNYDVDATWVDSNGYRAQLLAASEFAILPGIGVPGDPITSPVPVVVSGGRLIQVYTVQVADGNDFLVTMTLPQLNTNYAVVGTPLSSTVMTWVQVIPQSTTQMHVLLGSALNAGDTIQFVIFAN